MALIFLRLRELYKNEGGAFPDPILNLSWPYRIPHDPSAEELAMEYSGKALADLADPKDKNENHPQGGRTAGRLRPAPGRRHHGLRLLDLLRLLDPGRQHDGPP